MEEDLWTFNAHNAIVTAFNNTSFVINNDPVMTSAEVNYWQILCDVDTTGESFLDYMMAFIPTNTAIPLYVCNNYKKCMVEDRCHGTIFTRCRDGLHPTYLNLKVHNSYIISFGMCSKCYTTGQFCFLMKNKKTKSITELDKINKILWHDEYQHLSLEQKLNLFKSSKILPYEMFSAYVVKFPICANCKSDYRAVD